VLELLVRAIRERNKKETNKKRINKISIFADDMIVYLQDPVKTLKVNKHCWQSNMTQNHHSVTDCMIS
jgi:hypothetical protein